MTLTVEVLAERIEGQAAVATERDRRMQERYEAHQIALMASEKSLADYKVSANDWRATLSDHTQSSLTRVEYDARHQNLIDRLDDMQKLFALFSDRIVILEAAAKNRISSATLWIMGSGAVVALFLGVANIVMDMRHL